jgi:hypothetical protein
VWWDVTKIKIKQLCMEISKSQNVTKHKIQQMEAKLQTLKNNSTNQDQHTIDKLKHAIENFYAVQSEAARIRSKTQWYEEGEKSSNFFFNLEKSNGRSKMWNAIKTADGISHTDTKTILNEQVAFYTTLFSSEGWDMECANTLLRNIDKTITDDENTDCDCQVTKDEIKNILSSLKKSKSPGSDGITAELYVNFWETIKDEFMQVVQEIFNSIELSKSQYRGIITRIYKQGDRVDITHWCPITLFNADYKIISKILAERIKKTLPNIIHSDQKGFVKGRNISEAIRLIQDIIDYSDSENLEGAIICLDQQKAFDRVEWDWIDACLDRFGFSFRFRQWIQMLFKHGENRILTNGYLSKAFNISRSVRQGCPIAPLLYIIQAEPLASTIRSDPNVNGIILPNVDNVTREAKLVMFADDTHLINRTEESIVRNFDILDMYEKASGAKMNLKKTLAMYIGKWKDKKTKYTRISWTNKPFKSLGVLHGYNIDNDQIWRTKLEKVKNCLHV